VKKCFDDLQFFLDRHHVYLIVDNESEKDVASAMNEIRKHPNFKIVLIRTNDRSSMANDRLSVEGEEHVFNKPFLFRKILKLLNSRAETDIQVRVYELWNIGVAILLSALLFSAIWIALVSF
jgi:hypothetical protein